MPEAIAAAEDRIRACIARSRVPEDRQHAESVLQWVLRLAPEADEAFQIAALAHDIERSDEVRKVRRSDFEGYEAFKAAHALNSARMLRGLLDECCVEQAITEEACRLAALHEVGGDPRSDVLKDADSISFFEVNMPLYFEREGYDDTLRRCTWGYRRLSPTTRNVCEAIAYPDPVLTRLLREAIRKAGEESDG